MTSKRHHRDINDVTNITSLMSPIYYISSLCCEMTKTGTRREAGLSAWHTKCCGMFRDGNCRPRPIADKAQVIEKLIAGDNAATSAWDQAVRGEPGNPTCGKKAQESPIVYNIHNRPSGTSTDAGLRRLDKAAQAGDDKAAEMLRRVSAPSAQPGADAAAIRQKSSAGDGHHRGMSLPLPS
jgi:hypothetical protein